MLTMDDAVNAERAEPAARLDRSFASIAAVDLNLLVPLLALLEERSVTRAADRVRLSQPAMSHSLRRLRNLLGDELLVRRGGAMVLTPRAEGLIGPVRRALGESMRALLPPRFDPATDERVVSIAMTTSTAFVFGPLMRRLLDERAPRMTLRLQTGDLSSPDVAAESGADVVLLTEGLRAVGERERLYDDRWVVLASLDAGREAGEGGLADGSASDSSGSAGADSETLRLLEEEPHIVFEREGLQLRPYDLLERQGVRMSARHTVSNYLLIPHFLREVRGVALHRFQVGWEFRRQGAVQMREFPMPIPPLGIDMVWNPWLIDEAFKEWLRELLIDAAAPLRLRGARDDA